MEYYPFFFLPRVAINWSTKRNAWMATRNANLKEREESTEASEANGEEKRGWPRERKKERERRSSIALKLN